MRPLFATVVVCVFTAVLAGCGAFSRFGPSPEKVVPAPTTLVTTPPGSDSSVVILGPQAPNNTVLVPAMNHDYLWDQVVDVVDDYFQIDQEERVKDVGNIQTEGRIDTFPIPGATLLEPWRKDSVNYHERLESTLQSIRRRAFVRVVPQQNGCGGYLVEVTVTKELEDVPHPISGTAGAATFRYDGSLNRDTEFDADPARIPGDPARPIGPRAITGGWIPVPPDGRDYALEQEMLAKIRARLGGVPGVAGPGSPSVLAPGAPLVTGPGAPPVTALGAPLIPGPPVGVPATVGPGVVVPQPVPRSSQFPPGVFETMPSGGIPQTQELPAP